MFHLKCVIALQIFPLKSRVFEKSALPPFKSLFHKQSTLPSKISITVHLPVITHTHTHTHTHTKQAV